MPSWLEEMCERVLGPAERMDWEAWELDMQMFTPTAGDDGGERR